MENKKWDESLELSAQELEDIAGGLAEATPAIEYPSPELYEEYAKKVGDYLPDPWSGDRKYYKKSEYQKTEEYDSGSAY